MNATKQATWLFLVLISLACSAWYFASTTPTPRLDEQTLSATADAIVHHLTVRQYGTNGIQVNYLHTPLMRHTQLNNTHWFKTPHVIVAQENQPDWEIHAEHGKSLNGGQQIIFNKHVVIHQGKDEHTIESTLKTEGITYFPKDKLATTLLDITYERPDTIVRSKGMKAYLAEKRVLLLSQARGTYVPGPG